MNGSDLLAMLAHIPDGADVVVDHASYSGPASWAGANPQAATFTVVVAGTPKTWPLDGLEALTVDAEPPATPVA